MLPTSTWELPVASGSDHTREATPTVQPAHAERTAVLRRLSDLVAVRVLLTGESCVDLPRLWFRTEEGVDAFIRVCGFDTDNPLDNDCLARMHREAVAYLSEIHGYQIPEEVAHPDRVHDVLLLASCGQAVQRRFACMTLKVMHILHHLAGRELVFNTPISEAQLLGRLNAKVFAVIDGMRASGIHITEYTTGQKQPMSVVTKLLAKRTNLAVQIFDKLRFRIVVDARDDLIHAMVYLVRHLFPFNYVVPEQSQNGIIHLDDLARVLKVDPKLADRVLGGRELGHQRGHRGISRRNEFSGSDYRSVNFVADIPLRIDDVADSTTPAVAFVQAEIQLVDANTAENNEQGENAHARYKERQRSRVRRRLEGFEWGTESISFGDEEF